VTFYRVSLKISEDEFKLIEELANQDVRPIRDQIRFMLKESLEQRGMLPLDESKQQSGKSFLEVQKP
jgi:hypothetical protein